MKARGGVLVTHGGLPDWLKNGRFTREEMISIMQEHIKTLIGRYKGRVSEWLVANEAVWYAQGQSGYEPSNPFYKVIGPDFIELAFQAAREADPDAILIYNDYGHEIAGSKADTVFNLVKNLKEKGLIDAVGMQMHVTKPPNLDAVNPPTKNQIKEQIKRYKDIGVEVIITELDVDISRFSGTQEQKLARQAEIYTMIFEACFESGVRNITIYELNDEDSYITSRGGEAPVLFSKGKPKPAYYAIYEYLSSLPTS